ncbi:MAG: hypothetical protein JXR77_04465 [Lentisphaeria bacterium]|nr:hypothetical protein [Lentisphaeria bacterium]
MTFPRVERSVVLAQSVSEDSDERAFWLAKTPEERLEALELLREVAYDYDPTTARLRLPIR